MTTRRHGTVGSGIWPALPEDQKQCVLRQIGLHDGGMPRRVRCLFKGFGYSGADIYPALKRRLWPTWWVQRNRIAKRRSINLLK